MNAPLAPLVVQLLPTTTIICIFKGRAWKLLSRSDLGVVWFWREVEESDVLQSLSGYVLNKAEREELFSLAGEPEGVSP